MGTGNSLDSCIGLVIHEKGEEWRVYKTVWEDAVAQAAELELAGPRRISQRDRHSLRAGGLFQKDRCRRVRDHCGYKGHTAVGGAGG